MLDKTTRLNLLYDYYSLLLTDKQRDYMALYYHEDYSLGEIAELTKVSRQAVYDNIKRTEKILENYEDKLMLYKKQSERELIIKEIKDLCQDSMNNNLLKKLNKLVNLD